MSTLLFYQEQAAKSEADARDAVLDNVRDRCLRSALAWHEMAGRIERTGQMRAERESREALERE